MRTKIFDYGFNLWLSADDTYNWAHRPYCSWPCSTLSGSRVFVQFDRNGLCDMSIDGKDGDCDGTELTAIVADHMRDRLPKDHPCYLVAVGQFANPQPPNRQGLSNVMTLDIPTLKYGVGTKAYLDTFAFGLIPCIVTKIDTDSNRIEAKLTASRGKFNTYKRGEIVAGPSSVIVPRSHVFTRGFTYRIRCNYEWANL